MKKLCCDPDVEVCNLLKETLESRGIACAVRHESMPGLFDQSAQALPELWVLDDVEFERAWALIQHSPDSSTADDEARETEPPDA